MPPRKSIKSSPTFVSRHGLWSDAQEKAAADVERAIKANKLEVIRFSFADQHGVLRGKTLVASEAVSAMRNGVNMTSTLLAKDTAHKSVFPVFTAGGGFGMAEMQGGADFTMIADPATFRVLPWASKTGWLLCDIYFGNGKPVPFSTRAIYRDALGSLAKAGYDFLAGLEVEFHLFKIDDAMLAPEAATWPPQAPKVSLLTQGYQYLTETRFDMVDPAVEVLRHGIEQLGLPLRSVELELGPSQIEFTFRPQTGLEAADTMILFRAAPAADRAAPRLSRQLHVPPGSAQCDVERLASASVADRAQIEAQRLCRSGRPVQSRPILSRRLARACARHRCVHDADRQWLQALPALFAGAGSGDLGPRQSRRDDAAARRGRRIVDASGKSHR